MGEQLPMNLDESRMRVIATQKPLYTPLPLNQRTWRSHARDMNQGNMVAAQML